MEMLIAPNELKLEIGRVNATFNTGAYPGLVARLFARDGRRERGLWRKRVCIQIRKPFRALLGIPYFAVRKNEEDSRLRSLDRMNSPSLIANEVSDPARLFDLRRHASVHREIRVIGRHMLQLVERRQCSPGLDSLRVHKRNHENVDADAQDCR